MHLTLAKLRKTVIVVNLTAELAHHRPTEKLDESNAGNLDTRLRNCPRILTVRPRHFFAFSQLDWCLVVSKNIISDEAARDLFKMWVPHDIHVNIRLTILDFTTAALLSCKASCYLRRCGHAPRLLKLLLPFILMQTPSLCPDWLHNPSSLSWTPLDDPQNGQLIGRPSVVGAMNAEQCRP